VHIDFRAFVAQPHDVVDRSSIVDVVGSARVVEEVVEPICHRRRFLVVPPVTVINHDAPVNRHVHSVVVVFLTILVNRFQPVAHTLETCVDQRVEPVEIPVFDNLVELFHVFDGSIDGSCDC
jgi:hypothetical protein